MPLVITFFFPALDMESEVAAVLSAFTASVVWRCYLMDELSSHFTASGLPHSFIMMHQNRYQQCIGAFILQAASEAAKVGQYSNNFLRSFKRRAQEDLTAHQCYYTVHYTLKHSAHMCILFPQEVIKIRFGALFFKYYFIYGFIRCNVCSYFDLSADDSLLYSLS